MNIYLNILIYIKNLYFCQRLEFVVVWCLLNCLLSQIMLHKCAEMSLPLCVCVCVMPTPSHCYAFISVHFICQNAKKCPGHLCHTCVCVCVCVCVCISVCVCVCVCVCVWMNMLVPCCIWPQYQSFIYERKFSDLCQICWFYMPISIKMHSIAVTHACVCVCVFVCVCVCAHDRMFVPICICALDLGLYKNVKHFRFILGLLLFWTNET